MINIIITGCITVMMSFHACICLKKASSRESDIVVIIRVKESSNKNSTGGECEEEEDSSRNNGTTAIEFEHFCARGKIKKKKRSLKKESG